MKKQTTVDYFLSDLSKSMVDGVNLFQSRVLKLAEKYYREESKLQSIKVVSLFYKDRIQYVTPTD